MRRVVTAEKLEQAGIEAIPLPESDPNERIEIYKLYRELGGVAIQDYEQLMQRPTDNQAEVAVD
jgi:hypothetical protein